MTITLGLDVSHWNVVHWDYWADKGYKFVYIKATEGASFKDDQMTAHRAAAKQRGFLVGPYHFFRANCDPETQASHFRNYTKDLEWDLPPAIDCETQDNASQATYRARIRAMLLATENEFSRRPIIYTSRYLWHKLVGSLDIATNYDLWVAHYTTAAQPLIPDDWAAAGWAIWQFTSAPLDQNRFNGSLEDLKKWAGITPPSGNLERRVAALEEYVMKLKQWTKNAP